MRITWCYWLKKNLYYRLIETGYGMEINVEKTKVMIIRRQQITTPKPREKFSILAAR
jgi:hypothetical protein